MPVSVEYHIQHYDLEQGALEIQYIEEYFGEFPRKKAAVEIMRRLSGRAHIILIATAPLPDDPGSVVPVSFKVAHEIRVPETEPKLVDLMHRLSDYVQFQGRRVLYTWIGGTRRDWRGPSRSPAPRCPAPMPEPSGARPRPDVRSSATRRDWPRAAPSPAVQQQVATG